MHLITLLSSAAAASAAVAPRAVGTATVNLAVPRGTATALGSGFIYGFPDNGTSASTTIPDTFLTSIKFSATRAGGAQISAPGWAYGGVSGYRGRFDSTLSNYRTARKYNARFIMLVHDLWGAQGGATSSTPFPGDNGSWTEMEKFLNQTIADMKKNNMLDGVVIDLWNEPDLTGFWARTWDQYLEYIVRAHKIFKAQLPNNLISGPSAAHSPDANSANWQAWCKKVSTNNAIPDIYSWHQIGSWEREPDTTVPALDKLRQQYSLPARPIDINEYATKDEQVPSGSVFYLSQLERHDLRGLRSNWGSGSGLHDFMGNLVAKSGKGYVANGDWQVYKYYANMTGQRIDTTASADRKFDVFATKGSDNVVRILAGTRVSADSYTLKVTGLTAATSVKVRTLRFDWTGANSEAGAPADAGTTSYTVTNGQFVINVAPKTSATAYAFEFVILSEKYRQ